MNNRRYIVVPNEEFWAVWDTVNHTFAKYKGTWLAMCGMDEAYSLARILNVDA